MFRVLSEALAVFSSRIAVSRSLRVAGSLIAASMPCEAHHKPLFFKCFLSQNDDLQGLFLSDEKQRPQAFSFMRDTYRSDGKNH
jgi:hypothetical protein